MSLRDTYRIYKHTSPNRKVYIGVTREENLNRRWQNGKGYESCPLFWNAIQKYGWDNFTHEVIEEDVPIEQINERESYWIAFYKSNNRDFGYNIEEGGHAHRTFSDETRKKISDALKGRTKTPEHREKLRQANLGKVMSDESKAKISEAIKGRVYSEEVRVNMSIAQKKSYANGNNAFHSEEARKKAFMSLKGRKPSPLSIQKANEAKYRAVRDLTTGKEYKSIKDACDDTGVDRTTISRQCNGKTKKKNWEYL